MKPLPWSWSALSDFVNCPRSYFEQRIAKSVVQEKGEATVWGTEVHKHFEDRMVDGVVLPATLEQHEPYMVKLEKLAGHGSAEQKIGLNMALEPCGFFDRDVWFRGVIDYTKVNDKIALIVDYKTGKQHSKFGQLKAFAIHTFMAYPAVDMVRTQYYWTQTLTTTGENYLRSDLPKLWATLTPDLKQYAQAFHDDVWQPRQSGLCRGWCPVTTCEFWSPKRRKN